VALFVFDRLIIFMRNSFYIDAMDLEVTRTELREVQALRALFLHESNFQFVCNKCHDYGWADTYVFTADGMKIGYSSVWGTDRREDRDTIFEFYVVPPFRKHANLIFPKLHALSRTIFIESQSNDLPLTALLYEYARNIRAEAILFEDHITTDLHVAGATFRHKNDDDHLEDDDSDYVLKVDGMIAASGGLMLNYNMPYADIYMQVKEPFRQRGLGSLMVQELKREAYLIGRVPAARCNINNQKSQATLLKAGFRVCGFRLKGDIS
jgi:GNAT superfamily N-acetyltransferase